MNMLDYLTENLLNLVEIYVSELGCFIHDEQLEFLTNTKNLERVIHFSDKGTGAWCVDSRKIYFGSNTASFINVLKKL